MGRITTVEVAPPFYDKAQKPSIFGPGAFLISHDL
jgi:hypothetical protein